MSRGDKMGVDVFRDVLKFPEVLRDVIGIIESCYYIFL